MEYLFEFIPYNLYNNSYAHRVNENMWKSYTWTAVEETNKEAILAVINTNYVIVKIGPKKIQACTGFEPMTGAALYKLS